MRALALVLVFVLVGLHGSVRAENAANPHDMLKANGEADTDKCAVCHNPDMTLARSKLETCTLCHGAAPHAGATEHLRATVKPSGNESPGLPLTNDGHLYCGTCHLFHDGRVLGENPLPSPVLPAVGGLAGAVRDSLQARWPAIARTPGQQDAGAWFSTTGTRALRFPVEDGSLCKKCHTQLP